MWSIGRSKRTKNELLGSPITAWAFGAESMTWTSCALADAENASANRPTRASRRIENSMQDNFFNHARSKGPKRHTTLTVMSFDTSTVERSPEPRSSTEPLPLILAYFILPSKPP